jgi:uncharacterized protein YjbJ (UPF0337 family)
MSTFVIKGDWKVAKSRLQQRWSVLTDADLTYTPGQQDAMLGRIQKRTGQSRVAVEKAVREACMK